MLRRLLLIGSLPALLVTEARISPLRAQTAPERQQASLAGIKQAIVADTGYDVGAIELTASTIQVVVTVVNSKLTGASGMEREAEAGRIVAAITRTIAGNKDFRTVQAIHVDYVSREQGSTHSRYCRWDRLPQESSGQLRAPHHIGGPFGPPKEAAQKMFFRDLWKPQRPMLAAFANSSE